MKFNKILLSFAVGTLALGLAGCQSDDDFLEEHSYGLDSKTLYNTQNEIEMGLNACYKSGSSSANGGIQYLMYGPNGNHNYILHGPGLDQFGSTGANNFWNNPASFGAVDNGNGRHWFDGLFNIINYANTVIDMIDERPNITYTSDTKKEELMGEARFMRAWCYRNLAAMFGRVPILRHHTTTIETGYTVSERQEVWEFVKEDLTYAAEHMPKTPRMIGCPARAAADHFLAEVDLALGDFDGAIAAASRVIGKQDGDVELMTNRFGVRATQATDRYGHKVNAYWDLFRGDKNGNTNQDYGVNGNKEALWTAQFNYGTYDTGGSGMAWWRVRGYNGWESQWNPNAMCRDNAGTYTLKSGEKVYKWTADGACYPAGVVGSNRLASQDGITDPAVANRYRMTTTQKDSLGGGYGYVANSWMLSEHTIWDIWGIPRGSDEYKNIKDFRGSEAMMQRNWYAPSGKGIRDLYKVILQREKDNPNEPGLKVLGGDTLTVLQPRLWKISEDQHPHGNTQEYACELYLARVAETYLLRAEAYLAKGDKAKAAQDINTLRDRVGAPHCSASDIDIDYILDERTRELLGEEMRFVTLNRLSCNPNCGSYVTSKYPVQDPLKSNTLYERTRKYGISYTNANADLINQLGITEDRSGHVEGQVGSTPNVVRYVTGMKPWMYQYPIPGQVINSNSGAEYPQNPGY
ncbi:RagB/SusD family nutrient uptake outer membrane protein [Prevotella sp. KH2C16]|uniref:RagB/SusD family nutrient uptake outer membrane protein n=1 Tax=Prevotella sp. KH2C16 TaxID=1855325 RepID=UPI0008E0DF4A|nr:RagB/SusD family nutrient uptake outer membrane protein [Prevotella sp. KH2C16]SFF82348.1 Starch-binding associating with outer membrane [Prevotella sp. KH2C16]